MEYASVTIQLTPEDLVAFSSFIRKDRRRGWRVPLLVILWMGFMAVSHFSTMDSFFVGWGWITMGLIGIFVLLSLVGYRQIRSRSYWEERNPGLFLRNLAQVLDEGLYIENDRGQILTRWTAMARVGETSTHIFVMETQIRGTVIPKRCFSSPEAAANFADQARIRVQNGAAAAITPESMPAP